VLIGEQLDDVYQRALRLTQLLVDEDAHVQLLVTPVKLQQRLEASEEPVDLSKGTLKDVVDNDLLLDEQRIVLDPGLGVEVEAVM